MVSHRIIMTVFAPAALALAFAACAAEAQSPRAAEDHHKRGLALVQQGELDRAIAEFDKALELNPRLADAWCNRGIAYNSKGDLDHAMADLSQAIALDPRHSIAHYTRGVIFYAARTNPSPNSALCIDILGLPAYSTPRISECD